MIQKIKENIAMIAIAACLATMVSQCTTCARVANVGSSIEDQRHITDSLMIEYSNQVKNQVTNTERLEKKIDSAMYGGINKKPQQNYIVIKK